MQTSQLISTPALTPRYFRHTPIPVPSLPAVIAAATLALILSFIPHTMADPDIWWHLRNASELCSTHTFLTHDHYSFTAPLAPWLNHEWLAELPFYLGWRIAGHTGVYTVTALVIECIFASLLWLSYRASNSMPIAAIVTLVAAILSTVSFGPRTLLFGWLCLITELFILAQSRRRPGSLFALPVLFVLWINLHGSWIIGLILLLIYTITASIGFAHSSIERVPPATRTHWLATALCLPALLLNPYTWRLVAYPFNLAYAQTLNVANLQEWQSLDWHSPRGRIFFTTLAVVALRQLWRARAWTLCELVYFLIATYSAVTYSRFLFLFAILVAPIAAKSFIQLAPKIAGRRPLLNAGLFAVVITLFLHQIRKPHPDIAMQHYPTHAIPTLHGPLFHEFLWGGYLIWNQPQTPVFIDSRTDLFEANGTFRDYLDIIHLHNTIGLLDQHRIRYVLFEPESPLIYFLQQTGSWHTLYQDQTAILLERN